MGIAVLAAAICGACHNDVSDSVPAELPGTTWKFDDFYITFVSESKLTVHDAASEDALAQGTYSFVDGFIEVTLDGRVRAGSWNGERLVVDGMVGRFIGTTTQR